MKEGKDRQKEYRARQAERLERLKKLGLVEYRVVVPEPVASASSAFHRLAQTISNLYLDEQDFLDGIPAPDTMEAERAFLSSGAPQLIEFQIAGVGSVGLKMIPFRSIPTFCWIPLKASESGVERLDLQRFVDQFPMFQQAYALTGFHWKNSEYLRICEQLGIDSQWQAPEFLAEYEALGWSLLDWEAANRVKLFDPDGCDARSFIFDVLAVIRKDPYRETEVLPIEVKTLFKKIKPLLVKCGVPDLAAIEQVLSDKEKAAGQRNSSSCKALITFLPSHFGRGFTASIFGEVDDVNPDGWRPGAYRSLAGVAQLPDKIDAWTSTVVERLKRENGVIFLPRETAEQYLETEGRYWRFHHGDLFNATNFERFLWRVKPPKTPTSDYARQASIAAHILNQ